MSRTAGPASPALHWAGEAPHHAGYDDGYTASGDGLAETRHVFLQGNALAERVSGARRFNIGELGLGTGLSLAASWQLWAQHAPDHAVLNYVTCELEPLQPDDMLRALGRWPELDWFANEIALACRHLVPGYNLRLLADGRLRLLILVGDAAEQLQQLDAQLDAWFLDGFSPARNPAMWSPDVCAQMQRLSAPGATLATFTAAGWVRRNLAAAGFSVEKTPGHGRKRDMTIGRLEQSGNQAGAPHDGPVTVVGAGIAGASTAAALARLGRQVTLWDDAGHAPSKLPALLVRPWPERPRHPLSAFYASAFGCAAQALRNAPGWHPHGVALLAPKHTDALELASADALQTQCGVQLGAAGSWLSGAGCLEPASWIESLLDHPNIAHVKQRWDSQQTAGPIVFATGAAGVGEAATAGLPASITRGQMSRLKDSAKFEPSSSLAGAGLCARTPHGVWLGSSFLHDKLDAAPSHAEASNYLQKWQPLLPGLPEPTDDHRMALRVAGQGRMPYIGPLGNGQWVNWGHGSRGATAACLSAEYLAAAIDGHPLPLPARQRAQLDPQRVMRQTSRQKL